MLQAQQNYHIFWYTTNMIIIFLVWTVLDKMTSINYVFFAIDLSNVKIHNHIDLISADVVNRVVSTIGKHKFTIEHMKTRFKLSCSFTLLKNRSPSEVMQIIKEKKNREKKMTKIYTRQLQLHRNTRIKCEIFSKLTILLT